MNSIIRKSIILLISITIAYILNAQNKDNEYKEIDDKITEDLNTFNDNTIPELIEFINNNFSTETEKLRAAFVWIAKNFEYDVENMFAINFYSEPKEITDEMLKNKKGICMHFAYLFNEIGNKLKIKTHVISGYTKQRGFVDYVPHAWCASLVDSTWFLFDPTWGTGYIQKHKFVKKLNDHYFRIYPENIIKSHMPFDPLWQFLYYPVSAQEFYEGKTVINEEKTFFNYIDTLKTHENGTKLEQLISSNRRIEQNGVKNTITYNQLQNNTREIEYYKNQIIVEDYNSAVYFYNDGINKLNRFIEYRNKQFTPEKTELEIREMIASAEDSFRDSRNKLQNINTKDISTINTIKQLNYSIDEANMQIDEQKAFIDKYFSTKKIFRKSLFYKYTWMGIPLN